MRERGIVISTQGSVAAVRFVKSKACEGCRACQAFGEGSAILDVQNEVDARPGDVVEVEIPPRRVLEASFLVFLVPVMSLIAGYFLAVSSLHLPEGGAVAVAFACLGASFLGLRLYDRRVARRKTYNGFIVRKILADELDGGSTS
ncbi:MAG: SoxR reducing system RseC family protein [candidate division KSB1 bacterium]|nr:SoxR reducing system RseC family protein [candidate division KSB1 bacterium]